MTKASLPQRTHPHAANGLVATELGAEALAAALDAHAIVAVTDASGTITYANERFCEVSKYPLQELVGADHRMLNSGCHPPALFQQMWRSIRRGAAWRGVMRNRARDGTIYWVDVTILPIPGADGRPAHYVSIGTDVTACRHSDESPRGAQAQRQELTQLRAAIASEPQMLNAIGEAVIATDAAGVVTYANRAAGELLRCSAAQMLGKNIDAVAVAADPAQRGLAHAAALRGRMLRRDFDALRRDGSIFPARVTTSPLFAQDGVVAGIIGVIQDLTREHAARERIEAHNRGLEMLSRCNEAILRASTEDELLEHVCHEIAQRARGLLAAVVAYPLDESRHAVCLKACAGPGVALLREHAGRSASVNDLVRQVLHSEDPALVTFRAGDPRVRDMAGLVKALGCTTIVCAPLVEGGRAFGVLFLCVDDGEGVDDIERQMLRELASDLSFGIANLRAREDRRRVREAAQAFASAAIPSGCGAYLEDLTVRLANALDARGAVVLRYGDAGAMRRVVSVLDGAPAPDFHSALPDMFSDRGGPAVRIEHDAAKTLQCPTLRAIGARAVAAVLLPSNEGPPLGFAALAFDRALLSDQALEPVLGMFAARAAAEMERHDAVLQLQQLNAELEDRVQRRTAELAAVNRDLEAFSYSVSHDLRAPLAAINGFSRVVQKRLAGHPDDRVQHALARIQAGAVRMEEIIDALLSLSDLARSDLRLEDVDLSSEARQVVAELRESQPRQAVTVTIEPGLRARGDPRLVRQLLANLLGNAWKFTSREPTAHIELASELMEGETVFRLSDDGPGFDPAYADRLFRPFERLHKADEYPGTGIGLATVQRIVQLHGGRIWAETSRQGGATFCFTLASSQVR